MEEAGGVRPVPAVAADRDRMQFRSAHADPETEMAAVALVRMLRDRQFARYQTWVTTNRNFPREWRDAAGSSKSIIYLTPGNSGSSARKCWPWYCPGSASGSPTHPPGRRTRCRWRSSCCPTRSACPRQVTPRRMRRPPMIGRAPDRLNQYAPPRRRT